MKLTWEYPLITDEHSQDYHYEAPIILHSDFVYYACMQLRTIDFHVVSSQTGEGCVHSFPATQIVLPQDWFAFVHGDHVVYYTGELIKANGTHIVRTIKLSGKVTSHLLCGNSLLVVSDKLYSIDLDAFSVAWELNLSGEKPYRTGELTHFGAWVSCYGQNQLLFIDPESGRVTDSIRIPHIDKLYHPVALDDDTLLIGYTNWSNAGILKYQRSTNKVIWRHKRKFEGPQLRCRIWHEDARSYWVKNDTELICLSDETGEELFQLRTVPWLYTDLQFLNGCILYGTAGANGYINCLDARSGQMKWSVYQQNGCAYYGIYNATALVGDFSKTVAQLSLRDGTVVDQLHLDGEIVGRIKVHDGQVYTVTWGTEGKPVRLVKIEFSQEA